MKEINKKKIKEISIQISSSWFDIDKINEIEVNSLPEFFNNQYPSKGFLGIHNILDLDHIYFCPLLNLGEKRIK